MGNHFFFLFSFFLSTVPLCVVPCSSYKGRGRYNGIQEREINFLAQFGVLEVINLSNCPRSHLVNFVGLGAIATKVFWAKPRIFFFLGQEVFVIPT